MEASSRNAIHEYVSTYYSEKLSEHGATPRGVDWNEEVSHQNRHRQFLRLFGHEPSCSVLDLGCGYGDFLSFLRNNGHEGLFVGYDVSEAMIAEAKRIYGEGVGCVWHVGGVPAEPADYAVASGIANVKGDVSTSEWSAYVFDILMLLAKSSRKGFAANMLSMSSDPERRRANLFYADPIEIMNFCLKNFGRSVALLQDYGLYEFTIIVRHSD